MKEQLSQSDKLTFNRRKKYGNSNNFTRNNKGGIQIRGNFNYKDLTGRQFGYLKVIQKTDKRIQRKVVWECECVCGNLCEVLSTNLTSGRTTSCGCMRYEMVAKHYREKCAQPGDFVNDSKDST